MPPLNILLFANFYLGTLEEKIFGEGIYPKPNIYCPYVDYIFLCIQESSTLQKLKKTFEAHSSLRQKTSSISKGYL
jgi:hypothetical protein